MVQEISDTINWIITEPQFGIGLAIASLSSIAAAYYVVKTRTQIDRERESSQRVFEEIEKRYDDHLSPEQLAELHQLYMILPQNYTDSEVPPIFQVERDYSAIRAGLVRQFEEHNIR